MGAVYAVHHTNTGEALALKVLNADVASNPQAVERFRTEARAPVRIGSDHVVRVVDADVSPELGGIPFLVMEYLNGRDLATELNRRGALPAGEVCLYLRQIARALDRAHALGIIHRDLKPQNLFLTKRDDGTPLLKILDFGIAKLSDDTSPELTQDGTVFGTPWYMAPEQARGLSSKIGPQTDLWALGLIAFRLLTGRNYWTSEVLAALLGQILYEPMVRPSEIAPHLGPRFDDWFAVACCRDESGRFPNATEMVNQLAHALGVSVGLQATGMGFSQAGFDVSSQPIAGSTGLSFSVPGPGTYPPGSNLPGTYPPSPDRQSVAIPNGNYRASPSGNYPAVMPQGMPAPQGTCPPGVTPAGTIQPGGALLPRTMPSPPMLDLDSAKARKSVSVVGALAAGLLIAVVVAGTAAGAWMIFGKSSVAVAPTASVQAERQPGPQTDPAAAAPSASVIGASSAQAAPSGEPSAIASAASVASAASPSEPVALRAGEKGLVSTAKMPSAAPASPAVASVNASAKPPPKVAPKVGNIQF